MGVLMLSICAAEFYEGTYRVAHLTEQLLCLLQRRGREGGGIIGSGEREGEGIREDPVRQG